MSEAESLATAEAAREQWKSPSFLKELFLGSLRLDLIEPFPERPTSTEGFEQFYADMWNLLNHTDSAAIDATGEYPKELMSELRRLGAFGMKIPKKYGGLGLTQAEYDTIMKLLGSRDGNVTALLSAHQSIGAPQPLKLFGSDDQKTKYLPRLAAGAISAFALTEENVGSDPASMETTVSHNADGDYVINGKKMWCTNGTIAELIVVMAKHVDTGKMSAFILETADAPGFKVEHRCRFMGLRALANAVLSFDNVVIPKENIIGAEGQGLKIALTTLNTGRLSLPAGSVGCIKTCLGIARMWAKRRIQWGHEIGRHEAIAHKINDMAAHLFAMESVADMGSLLADRKGYDIRLEAAAAKEFNTFHGWKIVDDTMQIRAGSGYENETSLAARGALALPVERIMRDFRINLVFEGTSEIMHLFMAREAVDTHLKVAGAMIDPKSSLIDKLKVLPKIALFYTKWLPKLFLPRLTLFRRFGRLGKHMAFVGRACRKLARNTFYGMLVFRGKMQYKQAFLFRLVDIGTDLYAMTASILRAKSLRDKGFTDADGAEKLAEAFCQLAERRIAQKFRELWHNDDKKKYAMAQRITSGEFAWLGR
jgi:alkylation response protein AidB-like acyl-CoA dehydrogenase